MKIGFLVPQGYFNEFDGWEPERAWARVLHVTQLAEQLGFESIWTGEHVHSKWEGKSVAFDCWTLSTALAAAVPRVAVGFSVVNSTFHNPALTAKRASTLDMISGGRLLLGLGRDSRRTRRATSGSRIRSSRSDCASSKSTLRSSAG